jgi:VanZ family protein
LDFYYARGNPPGVERFCPKTAWRLEKMTVHRQICLKLPALGVAAGIWLLSSQAILPQPKGILGYDKLQHFLAYGVFTGALVLWFSPDWIKAHVHKVIVLVICLGSAYGIIDEIHQYFVPGRDCNIWDWLADTIGAVCGAFLAVFARLRLGQRRGGIKF